MPAQGFTRSFAFSSRAKPYRQQHNNSRPGPDPVMIEGLEDTHTTIAVPMRQCHKEEIVIKDVKYIGSYNWIKTPLDEPTIIVPGSPAHWREKPLPYNVLPDTGSWPADEHTLRLPNMPFLPLFMAVDQIQRVEHNIAFDWPSVDFITSRNVLRNLTRWTRGQSKDDFRIDLELVGEKTVLLNRWSRSNSEGGFMGNTFGISFEKESTTIGTDCEDATGNIRVVTYDLNGLKMVVRFEVNACISERKLPKKAAVDIVDALARDLERVDIRQGLPASTQGPLKVVEGGIFSQEEAIEITTRSITNLARNKFDWREAYPQLFLSQTQNHYLAIHNKGEFTKLEKRTLDSDEFQEVKDSVQDDLKKMHGVLLTVHDKVREMGKKKRLTLVLHKHGAANVLRVYTRELGMPYLQEYFQ